MNENCEADINSKQRPKDNRTSNSFLMSTKSSAKPQKCEKTQQDPNPFCFESKETFKKSQNLDTDSAEAKKKYEILLG